MGIREEYAAKEAASWEALLAQIARLTPEQQETEGVVPGWSTKDLLWHCAYWTNDVVQQLPTLMDGTFVDPFEADDTLGDRMNTEIAEASKAMTAEEAMARSLEARALLLEAWDGLNSEPTPAAAEWYAYETFEHYDEHAVEIGKFADSLGA
jgi:Mycothiol maleylpyruvate isomerase N-terminal domain